MGPLSPAAGALGIAFVLVVYVLVRMLTDRRPAEPDPIERYYEEP